MSLPMESPFKQLEGLLDRASLGLRCAFIFFSVKKISKEINSSQGGCNSALVKFKCRHKEPSFSTESFQLCLQCCPGESLLLHVHIAAVGADQMMRCVIAGLQQATVGDFACSQILGAHRTCSYSVFFPSC